MSRESSGRSGQEEGKGKGKGKGKEEEEEEERASKKYVRTFIYSMRVGTPVEKLHAITKIAMILFFSVIAIYMFDIPFSRGGPDLLGLILLLSIVLILLAVARTAKYLVSSYLIMALPVLIGEFLWWLVFNQGLAGPRIPLYVWPGYFPIGVSTGLAVLAFALVYLRSGRLFSSALLAALLWFACVVPAPLDGPPFTFYRIPASPAVIIQVPQEAVDLALAKALGYGVLIYAAFLFLLTTRDAEIVGALLQLKVKFKQAFFAALMFRNLNTILLDYDNVRVAQRARAAATGRNPLKKVIDLGYMSVPLIASMIKRSTEMGVALQARGFETAGTVTQYRETRSFTYVDAVIISLLLFFLVYVVIMGNSFTSLAARWGIWPR